ncbi:MAG: tetratricopeptide repeat protein, partial [Bacillota bacterium]|nr:tetratricopeptide repeat protein [Bacillota bacterium]
MRQDKYKYENLKTLARVFYGKRNIKRALEMYNKAYELPGGKEDVELLLDMAFLYDELEEDEEAEEKFSEVISINPGEPRGYYGLGIINDNRGEADKALEYYEKAIGLNPLYNRAYFFAANIYLDMGMTDKA